MIAGGNFGGEPSGRSTHPVATEAGFTSSKAANQITGATTGWNVTVFVSRALSRTLGRVFWQQPCDAGMLSICPHWFFIMRQQARSSVFIAVLETTQAIAGARHDTSRRTSTPNCRKIRIAVIRLRLPSEPSKWRFSTLPHPQVSRSEGMSFQMSGLLQQVEQTSAADKTSNRYIRDSASARCLPIPHCVGIGGFSSDETCICMADR
jgi:hypothetical protein